MLLYSTRNITNSFLRQSRPARQMLRPGHHPGAFRAAFGGACIHRKRVMAQLQQVLVSLSALTIEGDGSLTAMNEQIDRAIETLRVISLSIESAAGLQDDGQDTRKRRRPPLGRETDPRTAAALLACLAQENLPESA